MNTSEQSVQYALGEVVAKAWKQNAFYRDFWRKNNFSAEPFSAKEFSRVPILRKSDLLEMNVRDRSTFLNKEKYHFAIASSGTTASPIVSLHNETPIAPYYSFITQRCSYSALLVLRRSSYNFLPLVAVSQYCTPGTIMAEGDLDDLDYTARIAAEIRMDHLATSPSIAVRFGKILAKQGFPLHGVTFLYVSGEPLTHAAYLVLKELYSNALIVNGYSITEAGATMGHSSSYCVNLHSKSRNAYHLNTRDAYYEVIDGNLVVTILRNLPFPLIRYDTGDKVVLEDDFSCTCGFGTGSIAVVGPRDGLKSYKIGATVFRVEEFKSVLEEELSTLFTSDCEVYIEQEKIGQSLLAAPTLILRPKFMTPHPRFNGMIAKYFLDRITVSPNMSLGQAIKFGISKPLRIQYDKNITGQKIYPPREIRTPFEVQK